MPKIPTVVQKPDQTGRTVARTTEGLRDKEVVERANSRPHLEMETLTTAGVESWSYFHI